MCSLQIPLQVLWYISLINLLFFTQQTISQCAVVFVTVNNIEVSLTGSDWEGIYHNTGIQQESRDTFKTMDNKQLEYISGGWELISITNDPLILTTSNCCDPPIGIQSWDHGAVIDDANITMLCSTTSLPTSSPTKTPSMEPTQEPTQNPSLEPTANPTLEPTTLEPTNNPSSTPSATPTNNPSTTPSDTPSSSPTLSPTEATGTPSTEPSISPSSMPTRAPTDICGRIELTVSGSSSPYAIDGIYYQQSTTQNDRPWWRQNAYFDGSTYSASSIHSEIKWQDGEWRIINLFDATDAGELHRVSTEYLPPHQGTYGYLEGATVTISNVEIICGLKSLPPTTSPTDQPTFNPSTSPTLEPTIEPTQEPTMMPTWILFPDSSTTQMYSTDDSGGEEKETSFLDALSIFEWVIIVVILVLCCLVILSLYIWRDQNVKAYKREKDQSHLSAGLQDDEDIEMPKVRKKQSIHFDGRQTEEEETDLKRKASKKKSKANLSVKKQNSLHQQQSSYQDKDNADAFASALGVVGQNKSNRGLYDEVKQEESENAKKELESPKDDPVIQTFNSEDMYNAEPNNVEQPPALPLVDPPYYGDYPRDQVYTCDFITKPFGMEWKSQKKDKKNLRVSKVQSGSQADIGGVVIGSKLIAFNNKPIENLGAKKIYGQLAVSDMPLTITFVKPFKKESEQEGDNAPRPVKVMSESAYSEPGSPPASGIPPPFNGGNKGIPRFNSDNEPEIHPKSAFSAAEELIPQVFEENENVNDYDE